MELTDSFARYVVPRGRDVLARGSRYFEWQQAREEAGLWPYGETLLAPPGCRTNLRDSAGRVFEGDNYGSQDYLSLSQHAAVIDAAQSALRRYGVHSAGTSMLAGNTRETRLVEGKLAKLTHTESVLLFPTGWAAGFGVIAGLVGPHDHVVLDDLSHDCLRHGAAASGARVHEVEHCQVGKLDERLVAIREKEPNAGILVVTESLFSMDADSPDLAELIRTTRRRKANTVVDVAHDLGATGPGGTGELGRQAVLGQADLIIGSFSKTFAANGGFVASRNPAIIEFLRCTAGSTRASNGLSPLQCAVVNAAIDIVMSPDGEDRRRRLRERSSQLRRLLGECYGGEAPMVLKPAQSIAIGRQATRLMRERGVIASLIEYPAVPRPKPRIRFQLMSEHSAEQIEWAARVSTEALAEATENPLRDTTTGSHH